MDRISHLPDELICHAMSFLTTKEAASTSVLSKRWRNLFALVPNLDIDDSIFMYPEEGKREKEGMIQCFMEFVDKALALQGDSPIEKLSLKVRTGVESDRVNHWICNVLKRGVSDMVLFISLGSTNKLPLEIFMCKTLVKLKIVSSFALQLRGAHISLPTLKTLALELVCIDDGQLQMLISACPALEDLHMESVRFSSEYDTLSSASLKRLTLDAHNFLLGFSLDTPNLVWLKYSDYAAWDYPIVNLESLVEAEFTLKLTFDEKEQLRGLNEGLFEDDVYRKLGKVQKLVRGICNVQKLYLSPGALQVLALFRQTMPVFNNLTFLDVDSTMHIAWQAMPVLLRNCPKLETLVIKRLLHRVTDNCGDACICIPREDKGRSLESCPVKKLEIREFDGRMKDLEMIKHFLDYFPCLKEVDIYICGLQRFLSPLIPELDAGMLTRYNNFSGRSRNVKFKVHGTFPWTRTAP